MAVNIPPHLIDTINKMVRVSRRLLLDLGREPTPEEIAEKLAMPVEKVQSLLEIANRPIVLAPS
jgi:RNA polymerase primary sigma factor